MFRLVRPSSPLATALVATTLTAGLAAGCNKPAAGAAPATAAPAAAAKKPAKPALAVTSEPASSVTLPGMVELTGSMAPHLQSEVAVSVPGLVREVLVDVGTRVKKGDVLVRLDERDGELRQAQAAAATAQASARLGVAHPTDGFSAGRVPEVQVAKDALHLADTELARAKSLVEAGSAAQSLLDQAKARAEQARGQYDAALNGAKASWAAVQAARAAESITKKAIADTDVRAPFDGVIQERRVQPGEFAGVGRVVAVLVADDPIRVRVDLPEGEVALAQPGTQGLVRVSAWPDRVFEAKVVRVAAALRPQSRALPIELEVANPTGELKAGFFARVTLLREDQAAPAVLVPREAIGTTGTTARVFVVEGGVAIERIVALGRTWRGKVEVLGNLKAGEPVATSGLDKLEDGQKVTLTTGPAPAAALAAPATPAVAPAH